MRKFCHWKIHLFPYLQSLVLLLFFSLAHFLYLSLSFSCSKLMKLTYLWTRAESYYIHIKCSIPVTLFVEVAASGTASKQLDKAFFLFTPYRKKVIKILSACWVLVAFLDRNQVKKNHPFPTIQLHFELQWTYKNIIVFSAKFMCLQNWQKSTLLIFLLIKIDMKFIEFTAIL